MLKAARDLIGVFGFAKTTVADIAHRVGFSPSYVYQFFRSKQDIGNAVAAALFEAIDRRSTAAFAEPGNAEEKFRRLVLTNLVSMTTVTFEAPHIRDLIFKSFQEDWPSSRRHMERLKSSICKGLTLGRASGAFATDSSMEHVAEAIVTIARAFLPHGLPREAGSARLEANRVTDLILRSVASRSATPPENDLPTHSYAARGVRGGLA